MFVSGNVNDDFNFEFGAGTTAAYGCGATLKGEFWYFGGAGSENNRQVCEMRIDILYYIILKVSKIVDCKLVRQNDLHFTFYAGSCNSFSEPEPMTLLCFDLSHPQQCYV